MEWISSCEKVKKRRETNLLGTLDERFKRTKIQLSQRAISGDLRIKCLQIRSSLHEPHELLVPLKIKVLFLLRIALLGGES
jgi:hypothetical protein